MSDSDNTRSISKIKILFRSWVEIAHSYAIVNCFQIIHLYKNHGDKIEIYIQEMPYFRPEWNSQKKLVYNPEYNNIIKNLLTKYFFCY